MFQTTFRKLFHTPLFPLFAAALLALSACRSDEKPAPRPVRPDSVRLHAARVDSFFSAPRAAVETPQKPHRVQGLWDYNATFPDMNDVQLATAERLGVRSCADRDEAQRRKDRYVYIGNNGLYRVRRLQHSVPYLTPRAERLLGYVARTFFDSLRCKGLPAYKIEVSSVLRTEHDVERLRRINPNAHRLSCHRYGTTFDVCYNSFYRVTDPASGDTQQVWGGPLKEILAEVLRDARAQGLCYVRYERTTSCFHITAR